MYKNPLEAYEAVSKKTSNGREAEAAALTKAAMKLKACQDDWRHADGDQRLNDSLRFNQRIWTILQTELSNDTHPLPREVRLNLLKLSAFVDKRTFDIMAFPEPTKLKILIDINLNIASGLRQAPAKQPQ